MSINVFGITLAILTLCFLVFTYYNAYLDRNEDESNKDEDTTFDD